MVSKTSLSTLCLLSLTLPTLTQASNFWFLTHALPVPLAAKVENTAAQPSKQETKTIAPKHGNWEAVLSLGIGYRHDNLHIKLSPSDSSGAASLKSHYKELSSVMGVLRFDARAQNFLFSLEGDYAPSTHGELSQTFDGTAAQDASFSFNKLSGYEADAQAALGYRIQFFKGTNSRGYIIPQLGYRYSHQTYETYGQDEDVNSFFSGNVTQFMQDQSPMHSEWFGPFLEIKLSFTFWDHFFIDPYYQYHFLDYRCREKYALTGMTVDPDLAGAPASQQTITKAITHNTGAHGQSAGLDLYWQFAGGFRLGAKAAWLHFVSENAKAHVSSANTPFTTNPPVTTVTHLHEDAHAHWTNYSAYLYGGYSF